MSTKLEDFLNVSRKEHLKDEKEELGRIMNYELLLLCE